jgi:hypothetical protein
MENDQRRGRGFRQGTQEVLVSLEISARIVLDTAVQVEQLLSPLTRCAMSETTTQNITHRLVPALSRHRFALATFLLPLAIRTIPEILVGPYYVGWDTIGSRVSGTLPTSIS